MNSLVLIKSIVLGEARHPKAPYSYAADSCDDSGHLKITSLVSMEQALPGYNLLPYEGIDFRDE
jgi:hypothetical protein